MLSQVPEQQPKEKSKKGKAGEKPEQKLDEAPPKRRGYFPD